MSRIILPTQDDPVAASGVELLGGPMGRRAILGTSWWTPVRVCLAAAMAVYVLGFLSKGYCLANGWGSPQRYQWLCYSDIPFLYTSRGFADGYLPYLEVMPGGEQLEYPVLTGMFMLIAAKLSALLPVSEAFPSELNFYLVNVVMLGACLMVAVAATCVAAGRRPWDTLLLALAPSLALASTINWDLLAIALCACALALWAKRMPWWAGMMIGLGASAKLYPALLLGPLFVLCLREKRLRDFGVAAAGAIGAWLAVNVPFMVANFEGWAHFYTFSQERGMDFGSLWYALTLAGIPVPAESVNTLASFTLAMLCVGIAAIILTAKRRPRVAQVAFLTVAAFALTNKVYSPQFVMWLVPLAVLARPRWRDFLIWQAFEVLYFLAIWWYLVSYGEGNDIHKGLPPEWYAVATLLHILATVYFAAMVIRDIYEPEQDPVRASGLDDPAGGVLVSAGAGAEDPAESQT